LRLPGLSQGDGQQQNRQKQNRQNRRWRNAAGGEGKWWA